MGVNWAAGLIRWKPHVGRGGAPCPLHHLHPFRMTHALEAKGLLPAQVVGLHVAFSLHTFTRSTVAGDDAADDYSDNRETRTFDHDRYRLSFQLPTIIRELDRRPCHFAVARSSARVNYVTVDLGQGVTYGVFFDLMRWKKHGPNAVLLTVQSAYALDSRTADPRKGRITFKALLGHALRGTKPKPPP